MRPRLENQRSKRITLDQYEILYNFLENHPEMICNKLTNSFTAQRRDELWADLSELLNSTALGPQKTPEKWRKTWFDIRYFSKKRKQLKSSLNPQSLTRIKSLIALSNDLNGKENNCSDEDSIRIKECFTEAITLDRSMLNNGSCVFENETNPIIVKIANVSGNLSSSKSTCSEKECDIPSTSAESPCENMSNISTYAQSSHEQMSHILSTSTNISCEEVPDVPSTNAETSEIFSENNSVNFSRSEKTSYEKVCNILTMSMEKLNDVIKNSETRTITVLNALTEATARANKLHEKQLQVEEERNRLYQERTQILSTLINAFVEKKVNHQY